MDAFAVSLCKGLGMRKINWKEAAIIAFLFGGFQALMPFAGWAFGSYFGEYIIDYDHWIAFALLSIIGMKMIIDSQKTDDDLQSAGAAFKLSEVIVLAFATSVDALAVGITLAFLGVPILSASLIIGITTFCICISGVAAGNKFGVKFKTKAEILGGAMLIIIGLKILLEHLAVLP